MKYSRIALILLIVLAVAAGMLCQRLLVFADNPGASGNWFSRVCSVVEDYGCDRVLQSRYARILGHPTAAWGMAYFTFLAIWYLAVGRPNHPGRGWHLVPVGFNAVGAVMAGYLTWRMSVTLHALCPLCLAAHIINWVMLGLGLSLWPRRPRPPATDEPSVEVPMIPSWRLGSTTLALAVTLPLLVYGFFWLVDLNKQRNALSARLTQLHRDVDVAMLYYGRQPVRRIPIDADDPVRGPTGAEHTVVVFSDFQCPRCYKFAWVFRRGVESNSSFSVRIVFKHFPLSPACNGTVTRNVHANACQAAHAAEAARRLGGNEAFWAMHDQLFMGRTSLELAPYRQFARTLELDPDALEAEMADPACAKRISLNIAQAQALGVHSTPTVFLDGRVVEMWDNADFWNRALGGKPPPTSRPSAQ